MEKEEVQMFPQWDREDEEGWQGRQHVKCWGMCGGGGAWQRLVGFMHSFCPSVIQRDHHHHFNNINKTFQARNMADLINDWYPAYS